MTGIIIFILQCTELSTICVTSQKTTNNSFHNQLKVNTYHENGKNSVVAIQITRINLFLGLKGLSGRYDDLPTSFRK